VAVIQVKGDCGASLENGWYSKRYLHREPCKVLRLVKNDANGEWRSVCLIIPFPPGEEQDFSVSLKENVIELAIGGKNPLSGRFSLD
jgi:hypothetical protein